MKIRKIIALLLALAMCLSMAACGSKKEKTEDIEDPAAMEEEAGEATEEETEQLEEELAADAEGEEGEETPEEGEETEEEGPQSFNVILYGHALENVNVRNGAGKDFEKLDKVEAGSIVEIYEKVENVDGYTWYRIGEDMWVADDGTWFELCDSEIYTEGYFGVNPWDFTEELRQEWVLDQVKNEAGIMASTADPGFEWVITKLDSAQSSGVNYRVFYQSSSFGIVYNADCILSKVGDLTIVVNGDNRANYNPSVNYSAVQEPAPVEDKPVEQTVFEGQEAEVLAAVKAHCTWYDAWFAQKFPGGMTEFHGCDWVIDKQDDNVWTGYLFEYGETSADSVYDFCVTLIDGVYNVADTDGPYI